MFGIVGTNDFTGTPSVPMCSFRHVISMCTTAKARELLRGQEAYDRGEDHFMSVRGEKTARHRDMAIRSFKHTPEYIATRNLADNTLPPRARTPNPRDDTLSTRQWESQVQRWKKTTQALDPLMRVHPWFGACTFGEFGIWLKWRHGDRGPCYAEYRKYWRSLPILLGCEQLDTATGVNKGIRNAHWMGIWY